MGIGTRVVRAVTFQEVNNAPHAKAAPRGSAEGHLEEDEGDVCFSEQPRKHGLNIRRAAYVWRQCLAQAGVEAGCSGAHPVNFDMSQKRFSVFSVEKVLFRFPGILALDRTNPSESVGAHHVSRSDFLRARRPGLPAG